MARRTITWRATVFHTGDDGETVSGKTLRRTARLAAVGLAGVLALAACASDGDGGGGERSSGSGAGGKDVTVGYLGDSDGGGDAVDGGTLVFGSYSFPTSLDPTKTQAAGSTGGTEMAAIYDTLVRSVPETGDFAPQLAEKLEHNDDYSEFTITLREGTTFSDGSVLDAEAVKWSIDRFVAAQADVAQAFDDIVDRIEVRDERTVVFHLVDTWMDFPVLLSMGPGMIVAESSEAGPEFTPIGAGAFTLDTFKQNEEIKVVANDDYWDGRPHLDAVTFVPTAGARGQLEALESGQLNMAYIFRDEAVIGETIDAGYPGYLDIQGLGSLAPINNAEGRPGADVRVRQAIAYAIDPAAVNERSQDGLGIVSSEILPESSLFYTGAEGIEYDPDKARELLDEAKADGYDGKIEYMTMNEPTAQAAALVAEASLEAVGFDVEIDYVSSVTDLVRRQYVEHDFDMTRGAFAFMDEAPYLRLYGPYGSDSRNNSTGYADPETDEILLELRSATSADEQKDAIAKLQERVNETVPYVLWGPATVLTVWDTTVHDVVRSSDNIILLDKTWVD